MKGKKIAAMSFCAAAFVGAMTGTAFAGEVTGSGKGGPVKDPTAEGYGQPAATLNGHASVCAFSGLNDDRALPGTSQTQNYGHRFDDPFFIEFIDNTHGASHVIVDTPFGVMDTGCNKHAGA